LTVGAWHAQTLDALETLGNLHSVLNQDEEAKQIRDTLRTFHKYKPLAVKIRDNSEPQSECEGAIEVDGIQQDNGTATGVLGGAVSSTWGTAAGINTSMISSSADKFTGGFEGSFADTTAFFDGLDKLIGDPRRDVPAAVRREHCEVRVDTRAVASLRSLVWSSCSDSPYKRE
jgi:hypothetical protein